MTLSFSHCPRCERLNIHGATCVCEPQRESRCDCTHDGNAEHTGPGCQKRIDDEWAACLTRASVAAKQIRNTA